MTIHRCISAIAPALFIAGCGGHADEATRAIEPRVSSELSEPSESSTVGKNDVILVDELLGLPTDTVFIGSTYSGGLTISTEISAGAPFTISGRARVTEIGALVWNQSPTRTPFVVEIRPSVNGLPDPDTLVGSAVLSQQGASGEITYESARIHLPPLNTGTYYAMIAARPGTDAFGFVLMEAHDPFDYTPGQVDVGIIDRRTTPPTTHTAYDYPFAERVLGRTLGLANFHP